MPYLTEWSLKHYSWKWSLVSALVQFTEFVLISVFNPASGDKNWNSSAIVVQWDRMYWWIGFLLPHLTRYLKNYFWGFYNLTWIHLLFKQKYDRMSVAKRSSSIVSWNWRSFNLICWYIWSNITLTVNEFEFLPSGVGWISKIKTNSQNFISIHSPKTIGPIVHSIVEAKKGNSIQIFDKRSQV